jgi:hypothetical protein
VRATCAYAWRVGRRWWRAAIAGVWVGLGLAISSCALAVNWDALRRGDGDGGADFLADRPADTRGVLEAGSDVDAEPDLPDTQPVLPDAGLPADAGCFADAGCYEIPTGWALVGLSTTGTGVCPPPFEGLEVVADPTASSSSCVVGLCMVGEPPACGGTIATGFGGGCLESSTASAGCNLVPPIVEPTQVAANLSSEGGNCAASVTPNPIVPNALVCADAGTACDGDLCRVTLPPPFQVCIAAPGQQQCPATWGFFAQHLVGTSADVLCGAPTCKVTATCSGSLSLYTGDNCTGTAITVPADGNCQTVSGSPESYELLATPSNVGCTTGAVPTPMIELVDEQTVCCTQ